MTLKIMLLDTADIAVILNVERDTVRRYLWESAPGRRYAHHPFPAPDGKLGGSLYWRKDRQPEFDIWVKGRPGRGFRGNG
jgi:hypothetical protein